jgi:hypothetical protein
VQATLEAREQKKLARELARTNDATSQLSLGFLEGLRNGQAANGATAASEKQPSRRKVGSSIYLGIYTYVSACWVGQAARHHCCSVSVCSTCQSDDQGRHRGVFVWWSTCGGVASLACPEACYKDVKPYHR